ncbi:hypothetical protein M422DRAFT_27644 [Sphaerobolus stellatus SS14]|nr:hypothetical protein M422DRAFT_27644 [Sphaerobolus stellatus SS14]
MEDWGYNCAEEEEGVVDCKEPKRMGNMDWMSVRTGLLDDYFGYADHTACGIKTQSSHPHLKPCKEHDRARHLTQHKGNHKPAWVYLEQPKHANAAEADGCGQKKT